MRLSKFLHQFVGEVLNWNQFLLNGNIPESVLLFDDSNHAKSLYTIELNNNKYQLNFWRNGKIDRKVLEPKNGQKKTQNAEIICDIHEGMVVSEVQYWFCLS